tara:strand:- start:22 stop:381 length:360 start_codon:yes stop_codon:yes gene_type:complete
MYNFITVEEEERIINRTINDIHAINNRNITIIDELERENEIEKLADELENIWKSYSREVRNRVRARGAARARERGISVTNNNCRRSTLAEQRVQELIFENSDKIPEGLFIELMGSLVLR